MSRADEARFYGVIALVLLSVVAISFQLCWVNFIPRRTYSAIKSFVARFLFTIDDSRVTADRPRSSTPPPMAVTEIDDFQIQEALDEVEIFLAEVRRSALTQPAHFPSNRARQEFISNLLITKKVIDASSVTDKVKSDGEVILVATAGDIETGTIDTVSTLIKTDEESSMQCAICLVDYRAGDMVCFSHNSKCNHHFHQTCISHWLIQDRDDCPCCRNNYLALSDDDESDQEPSNASNENEDDPEPARSSPPNENDRWIPSYLAPFHANSRDVEPPFETTVVVEQRHVYAARSSREIMTGVQVGRWTDDDDSQNGASEQPDPDTWSCPSVEDSDGEWVDFCYHRRILPRRPRSRVLRPSTGNVSADEQNQSLQLGDLILEGLMQRLQDRSDEQSTRTASSGSVYTEGTGGDNPRTAEGSRNHQLCDESEVCAICCHEYAVNEELCWSQDPMCAHVFHRTCMQQWILDNHDYCPFCKPHTGEGLTLQSSREVMCAARAAGSSSQDPDATAATVECSVASATPDEEASQISETSGETLVWSLVGVDLDVLVEG